MDPREQTIELGRRLCAAFMSVQMGLGLEYTYKRYLAGATAPELGPYWIQLAQSDDRVKLDLPKEWEVAIGMTVDGCPRLYIRIPRLIEREAARLVRERMEACAADMKARGL